MTKIRARVWQIKKLCKLSSVLNIVINKSNFQLINPQDKQVSTESLLSGILHPLYFDYMENIFYFVELEKKIDHNNEPFFYYSLQKKAVSLMGIKIDDFFHVCRDFQIKRPADIIFLHHAGRTGSTLLHKILGASPLAESFSEDLIFDNLFLNKNCEVSESLQEKVFVCLINFLYQKYAAVNNAKLVFKMTGYSYAYWERMEKAIPGMSHIYLERNQRNQIASIINFKLNMYGYMFFQKILITLKFHKLKLIPVKEMQKDSMLKYFENDQVWSKLAKKMFSISIIDIVYIYCLLHKKKFLSEFRKKKNTLCLDYSDICNVKILQSKLAEYLGFKEKYIIDENIYKTNSQRGSLVDPDKYIKLVSLSDKEFEKRKQLNVHLDGIYE